LVPLHLESLTGPDGAAPTYLALMQSNVEAIAAGLRP
jgi:ABC-type Zn uptake system ZnuABC Zn-binding protein ZnuA